MNKKKEYETKYTFTTIWLGDFKLLIQKYNFLLKWNVISASKYKEECLDFFTYYW